MPAERCRECGDTIKTQRTVCRPCVERNVRRVRQMSMGDVR